MANTRNQQMEYEKEVQIIKSDGQKWAMLGAELSTIH